MLKKYKIIQSGANFLYLRYACVHDRFILDELIEDNSTEAIYITAVHLGIRWNDKGFVTFANIHQLTRRAFSELSEFVIQSIGELKSIDENVFIRNVWRMNGGNYNGLEVFYQLPIRDYIELIKVHNEETKLQNAKMTTKMNNR